MMVRSLRVAFAVVILLVPMPAHSQSLSAAFEAQFFAPDARSAAMGGAFTAIAEGPNATWWNPGALAFGKPVAVMPFSYTKPFPLLEMIGADHSKVSFGVTGHRRSVGVGIHYDHFRSRMDTPLDQQDWGQQFVRLGAGVDIASLVAGEGSPIRCGIGASAKLLRVTLSGGATNTSGQRVSFDDSDSVVDLDLGGLFVYSIDLSRPRPRESAGRASYLAFRSGMEVRNVFDRKLKGSIGGEGAAIGG
ncbi:MAG: hypothetical protein K8E66_06070, partial [Phycisphaerales bacterium]|nr:hypothetical protein [Phycisphaerales bacterium]